MTYSDHVVAMETVSDERLAEMLAGLEGVTPGPWVVIPDGTAVANAVESWEATVADCEHHDGSKPWGAVTADAAHIQRLDPATVRSIISELLASRLAKQGWQGIESAPKSDRVLAYFPPDKHHPEGRVDTIYWSGLDPTKKGYWVSFIMETVDGTRHLKAHQPTHWQPLPAAPSPVLGEPK